MAKIERMTVVFPEPMADELRRAVEEGEYATTSEAVRDAVRAWQGRRRLRQEEIERLRRAWDEGKASGEPIPWDPERFLSDMHAKYPNVADGDD